MHGATLCAPLCQSVVKIDARAAKNTRRRRKGAASFFAAQQNNEQQTTTTTTTTTTTNFDGGRRRRRRDVFLATSSSVLFASVAMSLNGDAARALEAEEQVSEVAETIVVTPPSSSSSSEPFGNKTFMEGIKDKDYGKSEVLYSDFTRTASGLQYKDVRPGAKEGKEYNDNTKIAVVDWDGYTLGYYGRPFEARNGPKGGAFNEDKDFFRFRADDLDVLPAFREAIVGMKVGAIRRIIVPPNSGLAYPENKNWKKMKPKPNNFSGERALGFVLENQGMIDKTLLFDIELMDVR
jgi:FKBP-type peptidyl-prolyl cis-trans isomerase